MNDWKVSLIATVRNERNSIAAWVEAIARQTRAPDEVVVCDGGSTDGTLEELQRQAERFPLLRLRIITRGGANPANIAEGRNAAIASAAGPLIAVTDAGCMPREDWLAELAKPFDLEKNPAQPQFVAGSYRYGGQTKFQQAAAAYLGPAWLKPNFRPSSRSVAFTKSAWALVGGYPEWLTLAAEDTLFNELIYARPEIQRHFAPEAIVVWEMRADLGSFLRMIRRNAFGDAEAGLGRTPFLRGMTRLLAVLFLAAIAASELAAAVPETILKAALPFIAAMAALAAFVATRGLPPGAGRLQFLLLKLLGGPHYLLGYLHGLLRGRAPPVRQLKKGD